MPRIQPGPRSTSVRVESNTTPKTWEARLRLWIAIDGRNALGPGKVRLLDAIANTRSLAAAAKRLRMSYRAAWRHLRFVEERTGIAVVEPKRGGAGGGGTKLTQQGEALLHAYHDFRRDVEKCVQAACQAHFARWSRRTSATPSSEGQVLDSSGRDGHNDGE